MGATPEGPPRVRASLPSGALPGDAGAEPGSSCRACSPAQAGDSLQFRRIPARQFPPASKSSSLLGNGHGREKQGLALPRLALSPRKAKARLGVQARFEGRRGTLFPNPRAYCGCLSVTTEAQRAFSKPAKTSCRPHQSPAGFFTPYGSSSKSPSRSPKAGALCLSPGSPHPKRGMPGWDNSDNTYHCGDMMGQDRSGHPPGPASPSARLELPLYLDAAELQAPSLQAELRANAPHASGLITALIGIGVRNLSLQLFAVSGEEEKALRGINFNYKDDMLCVVAGRQAWPSCSRCAVPAMSTAAPHSCLGFLSAASLCGLWQGPEGPSLPGDREQAL